MIPAGQRPLFERVLEARANQKILGPRVAADMVRERIIANGDRHRRVQRIGDRVIVIMIMMTLGIAAVAAEVVIHGIAA